MNVLQIINEADHRVPASAPPGTQWRATSEVTTPCGRHAVAIAARIDIDGHRREQFWCDDVPVERHVLLRLTCEEAECPQVIAVRAQWLACHGPTPADAKVEALCPRPLMTEVPVVVGRQHFVARPGRFPCFTPCPHGAHPPLRIDKSGFDLFEDGTRRCPRREDLRIRPTSFRKYAWRGRCFRDRSDGRRSKLAEGSPDVRRSRVPGSCATRPG